MSVPLDALQTRLRRDLFAPLIFRLSLKVEQVGWRQIVDDPALASFTLRSGRQLFGADVFVNWFDDWLEAEAAGVRIERDGAGDVIGSAEPLVAVPEPDDVLHARPVGSVLDVTRRLCRETGDDAAVFGYVTGGATLLARLFGDAGRRQVLAALAGGGMSGEAEERIDNAARISAALTKAYCDAGVNALLLVEHDELAGVGHLCAFDALFNLAGYYGVPVFMLSRYPLDDGMRVAAREAGAGHVIAPDGDEEGICCIPSRLLRDDAAEGAGWVASRPGRAGERIFVSQWDLSPDVPPEAVIALGKEVAG